MPGAGSSPAGHGVRRGGKTSRSTRQGAAISAALGATETFATAQELHSLLRATGDSIGLTTVYRHLQVLVDRGEVDVLRQPDGETLYRRCVSEGHHHHLVCRACGLAVEVSSPDVEAWAARVAAAEGFVDVTHTVEISGLCRACSPSPRRDP
ncbi:transcriptional repressor [Frankia sp. CNm7]|uniref:Transcriptional repressor n=1 Tax=Frankia nepalensis TaxID=1836974 RepID=A0A937RFD7_9ACTN|nr:transcriptional repressor [Frankia nepalensis]MBL7499680.1 transcriptional repressor [Frankia nepalensis]MBL7515462.1 transcriptional repressor [Frankia nepalensis]MBL7522601.1 transcriptional repressor [Frankia nepalensis]MBL7629405.1 transcriptional repressor [Frankia nepalensis]